MYAFHRRLKFDRVFKSPCVLVSIRKSALFVEIRNGRHSKF